MENAFGWPEAAIATLRQRKAEGASNRMIADELSRTFKHKISRNAVIGKAMRLGIELSPAARSVTMSVTNSIRAPKKPKAPPKPKPVNNEARSRRARDLLNAAQEDKVVVLRANPDDIATDPKGIMALTSNCCRWPLNRTADDGSMLFCCNTKLGGKSYCEGHAKRAFQKTRTNEQKESDRKLREERMALARASGYRDSMFGFGVAKRFYN